MINYAVGQWLYVYDWVLGLQMLYIHYIIILVYLVSVNVTMTWDIIRVWTGCMQIVFSYFHSSFLLLPVRIHTRRSSSRNLQECPHKFHQARMGWIDTRLFLKIVIIDNLTIEQFSFFSYIY